tara:strand:- start:12 stop:152 length:141 start_codon:yes stop_codon:yes gene_type:complete
MGIGEFGITKKLCFKSMKNDRGVDFAKPHPRITYTSDKILNPEILM